jgi:hypothetical protein
MTMRYDQDTIDEYRKPEYHGEHLTYDEGCARYEAHPDFLAEAIDATCIVDDLNTLPEGLRDALAAWYRTTKVYESSVQHVIADAAKPS